MAMVFEKETNLYQNGAIASKFRSQDTQFQVIQGKISYLISDSEIEEYDDGSGTITSRMNSAESTIEGNTSLISALRTDYDALSGEITEYESSTNEFKQTTNSTISTITQTVQTKTRTFNTQPEPPYAVNDLWFKNRDLYVCTHGKETGQSYSASDWVLATKYTDDSAITSFINSTYASDMSNLQTQVDGKIETWNQAEDPSTTWTTSTVREKHTGDLWYKTTDGTTWRYTGSAWVEQNIPTSVLTNINGKAKIFIAEPYTPYSEGDLWVQGETGDILRCINAKSTGSFTATDWEKASKYTDDSTINTFINGAYADTIAEISGQLDIKAETWYQINDPSVAWNTEDLRLLHDGDLWYNSRPDVQKYYRYKCLSSRYLASRRGNIYTTRAGNKLLMSGFHVWEELTANPPTEVFDAIDGKAQIFVEEPVPPYSVGDIWVNANYTMGGIEYTNEIMRCQNSRQTGNFDISDWIRASKYTDDSGLSRFVDSVYNPTILSIESTLDGKIDTWFYPYEPALSKEPTTLWETDADKSAHIDDLFYDTEAGFTYRFVRGDGGYAWERIKDSDINSAMQAASEAQDTADGKRRVFTVQPTQEQAYDVGDLWVNATYSPVYSNDLLKCKQAKAVGVPFNIQHWEKASKYTDDSTFNDWQTTTYQSFIEQLPNQINLQVTGSGNTTAGEVFAAKASIIAEINDQTHESGVTISANRLNLTAYSTTSQMNSAIDSASSTLNSAIQEKNTVYHGIDIPASDNAPAVDWDTSAKKALHVGDLYCTNDGAQYQYTLARDGLLITLSKESRTEGVNYDYISVYYKDTVANQWYRTAHVGGTDIAGAQFFVPSNTFYVFWASDSRNSDYYGFSIDSVERVFSDRACPNIEEEGVPASIIFPDGHTQQVEWEIVNNNYNLIQTAHNPYAPSFYKVWKYIHTNTAFGQTPEYRWVKRSDPIAKSELTIMQGQITSRTSANGIVSTINQSPSTISIDASKISFTSGQSTTDLASQITLMNGTIESKTSAEGIASTINQSAEAITIQANKINLAGYVTFEAGNAQYASQADASANEQYIYYQKNNNTAPTAPTTWVTSTSDTNGEWTTRRPTYRSDYPYIFVAQQRKTVNNSISCTSPLVDQTTTVINGSSITTGSISADLITTGSMSADRIYGGTIKLGGSNNRRYGVINFYDTSDNYIGGITGDSLRLGSVNISDGSFSMPLNVVWFDDEDYSGLVSGIEDLYGVYTESVFRDTKKIRSVLGVEGISTLYYPTTSSTSPETIGKLSFYTNSSGNTYYAYLHSGNIDISASSTVNISSGNVNIINASSGGTTLRTRGTSLNLNLSSGSELASFSNSQTVIYGNSGDSLLTVKPTETRIEYSDGDYHTNYTMAYFSPSSIQFNINSVSKFKIESSGVTKMVVDGNDLSSSTSVTVGNKTLYFRYGLFTGSSTSSSGSGSGSGSGTGSSGEETPDDDLWGFDN